MEPRTIVGMASEHSEGTLACQHHQSPRPTPVSHETLCVLLCLVCLALDCVEICGGFSVEFSRRQFYSYKISPILRRTLRRSASPHTSPECFASKLRRTFRHKASPSIFAERALLLLFSICHLHVCRSFFDVRALKQ